MLTTHTTLPDSPILWAKKWLLPWNHSTARYPVLRTGRGIPFGAVPLLWSRFLGQAVLQQRGSSKRVKVAAVDIGTNSTRLMVAEAAPGGLDTLLRTTKITRLGAGVDSSRSISREAMERTTSVLEQYAEAIRRLGAERVGVIATSACRDAHNREEFFGRVREVLGTGPLLLSGESEAALSFAGAVRAYSDSRAAPFLVVDIGGGSTELSVGRMDDGASLKLGTCETEGSEASVQLPGFELFGWTSLEIGCVRLSERYLHGDPPTPEELHEAIRDVEVNLVEAERAVPIQEASTFIGLAGTVTSLAAMDLKLDSYDPDAVHHHRLTREAIENLFRYLASSTLEELRGEPGLEPERAEVIVGGAVVLTVMMRRWGFDAVVVSEADILDGVALATSLGLIGSDAS